MLALILVAFREGLEAALIVGIVLGYLKKTGQTKANRYAWAGVLGAVAISVGLAVVIQAIGAELEGRTEQIFEGVTMALAVVVLTWMIFWMSRQARTLKSSIEHKLHHALDMGGGWGLAAVAFAAVFREGVETALLLSATAFASQGSATILGVIVGLGLAVALGYLIYASTVRLNLRQFFNVTSVLLLFFAAGLMARSVLEFQEAQLLPTLYEHLWDTSALLDESSVVGQIFKTLFGYTSQPSLESVLAYAVYCLFAFWGIRWWLDRRPVLQSKPAI